MENLLNGVVTNTFNTLRPRIWRVNNLSGDEIKTISPILMANGNPDENPQTAHLNDSIPIYFDRELNSDSWVAVQRKNNRQFEGHVGIISLSAQVPFEQIQFRKKILSGLGQLSDYPAGMNLVVIADDDGVLQTIHLLAN